MPSAALPSDPMLLEDALGKLTLGELSEVLADREGQELHIRYRAMFHIKERSKLSPEDRTAAVAALSKGLMDPSALFRHEICYVLGQVGDPQALEILKETLSKQDENCMVRHEAAEALAAIDDQHAVPTLSGYATDPSREVRETVELSLARLKESNDTQISAHSELYGSTDPSPPAKDTTDVDTLGKRLMDPLVPLYDRYKAMFALRDIGTEDAVQWLCKGMEDPDSALFRHEVAFVLGQLQHADATDALMVTLRKSQEHAMVRHEAAEALGSIATGPAWDILKEYAADPEPAVAESCQLALSMHQYWSTFMKGGDASASNE